MNILGSGPFCVVVTNIDPAGNWDGLDEVVGPFQSIAQLMDYVFGRGSLMRARAEKEMSGTNIPFRINHKVFIIAELNSPFSEDVQKVNRIPGKGNK